MLEKRALRLFSVHDRTIPSFPYYLDKRELVAAGKAKMREMKYRIFGIRCAGENSSAGGNGSAGSGGVEIIVLLQYYFRKYGILFSEKAVLYFYSAFIWTVIKAAVYFIANGRP